MSTKQNTPKTSAEMFPHIVAELGHAWLSKWAGRMTDAELARQDEHSKHRLHEAECEAAAIAILRERVRS